MNHLQARTKQTQTKPIFKRIHFERSEVMSFRHIVLISLSLLVIGAVDLDGQYAQSAKEKFSAIDRTAYTPDLHFYRPLFQSNRTSSTKAPRKKQRALVRFVRPHFVDWNRFEKKWTKQRYVTQKPASRCYLCLLQKLIGDCIERCLLVRFDRCAISERVSYNQLQYCLCSEQEIVMCSLLFGKRHCQCYAEI